MPYKRYLELEEQVEESSYKGNLAEICRKDMRSRYHFFSRKMWSENTLLLEAKISMLIIAKLVDQHCVSLFRYLIYFRLGGLQLEVIGAFSRASLIPG
jgi:hypothetical protein